MPPGIHMRLPEHRERMRGNKFAVGTVRHRPDVAERERTHGHTVGRIQSTEYHAWANMLQRCTNPRAAGYENYGGRGIKVCRRWFMFENFLADMGEKPVGLTLDRINNDGDYRPNNCRWTTRSEQQMNRRRFKPITEA